MTYKHALSLHIYIVLRNYYTLSTQTHIHTYTQRHWTSPLIKCVRTNSLSMGPLSGDVALQQGQQTKAVSKPHLHTGQRSSSGTCSICWQICGRHCAYAVHVCVCACVLWWESVVMWLRQCSRVSGMSKQMANRLTCEPPGITTLSTVIHIQAMSLMLHVSGTFYSLTPRHNHGEGVSLPE